MSFIPDPVSSLASRFETAPQMSVSTPSAPSFFARANAPAPPMSISDRRALPSAPSSIRRMRFDASRTGDTRSFQTAMPMRMGPTSNLMQSNRRAVSWAPEKMALSICAEDC